MLRKSLLALVALGCAAAPVTDATASRARAGHARHHAFSVGYHQNGVAYVQPGYRVVATPPVDAFAAALLGATYGYWSDGYRVYGGDPCYVYNDRDWEFERVC